MNFTSLDEALSKNFIKSLPHLTRLDLNANEIKLIELALSFSRTGNEFYMNYADIAGYLHLGDTKTKAKSVGNVIGSLKRKGYVITTTIHNFNGKNGGSSANIKVDEAFLERQLHAHFNSIVVTPTKEQISPTDESKIMETTIIPKPESRIEKSFMEELEEMDNQDERVVYYDELQLAFDKPKLTKDDTDVMSYQSIETLLEFDAMLKRLIRKDSMKGKKSSIQHMIDNPRGWDIDQIKEAFESSVLTDIYVER